MLTTMTYITYCVEVSKSYIVEIPPYPIMHVSSPQQVQLPQASTSFHFVLNNVTEEVGHFSSLVRLGSNEEIPSSLELMVQQVSPQ